MLDEIKEFKQYTFNLNDKNLAIPLKTTDCRLNKTPLIKDFSGVTRALTIIARYYMYNKDNNDIFNAKDVNHIKEVLRAWCGFATQEPIPEIDGWLNLYIRKAAFYSPAKACVEEFIKTKKNLESQLCDYEIKKAEIKKLRPRLGEKNLTLAVQEKYPELTDAIIFDTLEKIFPETTKRNENNKDCSIREKAESLALKTTIPELIEKKERLAEVKKQYKDVPAKSENLKYLTTRIAGVNKIIDVLIKLKNKARYYNRSFYNSDIKTAPYDLNTITLDRIIANAFTMGKLEQYYLVCDCNPFEATTIKKNTTESNTNDKKKKGKNADAGEEHLLDPGNNDKDLILKATACYLLQKRFTEQKYVVLNKTDLANWMWEKRKAQNCKLHIYRLDAGNRTNDSSVMVPEEKQTVKFEPIFNLITLGEDKEKGKKGTSIVKFKVHPEWLKHFRLVKIHDINKPNYKNSLYFSDGCHNSYLIVNNWTGTPIFDDKEKKGVAKED